MNNHIKKNILNGFNKIFFKKLLVKEKRNLIFFLKKYIKYPLSTCLNKKFPTFLKGKKIVLLNKLNLFTNLIFWLTKKKTKINKMINNNLKESCSKNLHKIFNLNLKPKIHKKINKKNILFIVKKINLPSFFSKKIKEFFFF